MEIMVTDPENLGARIGLDELKRRKASGKQTAPAAAPKAHASRRARAAQAPTKKARATKSVKPAKATKTSKGKGEWQPICRYCGSRDLAPSFIKRHDARCRACFKNKYAGKYGAGAKSKRTKK